MHFFGPIAGWWPSRVRAFLELEDPGEQMEYWERELNTWRFRAAVDELFSVTALLPLTPSPCSAASARRRPTRPQTAPRTTERCSGAACL